MSLGKTGEKHGRRNDFDGRLSDREEEEKDLTQAYSSAFVIGLF
jgi:hypothetical protein